MKVFIISCLAIVAFLLIPKRGGVNVKNPTKTPKPNVQPAPQKSKSKS